MAKTLDEAGVKRLIQEIKGANKNLNTPIPISTENTPESMAQNVKNIADYVEKAKAAGIASVNGMAVTCLIDNDYSGVGYLYGDIDVTIQGIKILDDLVDIMVFNILDGRYTEKAVIVADNNTAEVTSLMLNEGARRPIILTPNTTEVDEETYQKLISDDVDVMFKTADGNLCALTYREDCGEVWKVVFTCLSGEYSALSDLFLYAFAVNIVKDGVHKCTINTHFDTDFDTILTNTGYLNKYVLSPVLQEIDLTGTDAERKAKLDKFEANWKALTRASDLTGARFVGKFGITDDIERNVTGIMTYSAGDEPSEKNDNHFYGICNGYSFSRQKSQIAVKVSCKDGSLTITPLFSHLEAIAIKTGNTSDINAANVAAINAYVDNLKALGVDTTKGYEIPILYNSGSKGFIGYNPNAASSFNGYAVTPEGNLHTLTMNATTGALSNKILATTAITDALSTNKQPKTDAALKTTSKTITGAINEVNDKTVYMAFTDVTKLSTNLGKRLIYKGGNVTLSSPITINSNINEIDFNGATLTVGSLAKTGISVITGHSHCIIKNLIISGTWSVNTDTVNNIIDTFSGVENVSVDVTINGTHYGRGFHNCQRLTSCKSEIKGVNITEGRAYNYCEYLYMCRVGANSKGTGFFHCTSMDSCDIFNGGCIGSELIECSKYTKVSYYVSGNRRYFSDVDNISTKTLQINGINIANIAELSNVIANSSESVNSVPIIDPNDKSIQKMGVVIGNADNGGTGYSDNPTVVVRNTSGNIFINDGHYNGIGCTTKYAAYLVEQNKTDISGKQDKLISGTNIKTVNGQSLLGSGNITISGGGDVTAAGDNTFTGNNVFNGITIADILDGTQYQITGDNGVLMFASGATNDDIEISGVATPTYSNSAANKSYVDTQISTALGTVLTQLQNI